jgi:PIN like domain
VKFFLDENVNRGCLEPLRALYRSHDFHYAFDEGLSSTDDVPLFEILQHQRYDAIITKDRHQLSDDAERRALYDAGLHWIGHKAKQHDGLFGIVVETATVTAGLIFVLRDWRPEPHVYTLRGVESDTTQRLKIAPVERAAWNLPPKSGGINLA